jgi:hypothetical protein
MNPRGAAVHPRREGEDPRLRPEDMARKQIRATVASVATLAVVAGAGQLSDIDVGSKVAVDMGALSSDPEWRYLSAPGVYVEEVGLGIRSSQAS